MRRLLFLFIVMLPLSTMAQENDEAEAIMRFTGTVNPEELDVYEVERLSDLFHSPLRLNMSSMSALEKSGLFTPFQLVSLTDYLSRHGDILSVTELGLIDGFSPEMADRLSPFISLVSRNRPGEDRYKKTYVRNDLQTKAGWRHKEEGDYMCGVKYRMGTAKAGLTLGYSRSYSGDRSYSGNLVWNHSRGQLILGDFNARFGQGLCMWNSAYIGGYTSPSAFMRRPSGLSPSFSFTGSSALTGVAGDVLLGRCILSAFMSLPGSRELMSRPEDLGLAPSVNLAFYGSHGSVSFTHYMKFTDFMLRADAFRIPEMRTSLDASFCIKGVNVFTEVTYDWIGKKAAAVCGTDFSTGEYLRLAALLKYCPSGSFSNEYGAAVSGELKLGQLVGVFSTESFYHPESKNKDGSRSVHIKAQTNWDIMVTQWLKLRVKLSERFRTWGAGNRAEARMDAMGIWDCLTAAVRVDMVRCEGTGLLGYMEGGFKNSSLSVHLRLGAYKVDDWDDRIYVYERDAPGSFNVPAYYGRGVWTALAVAWKYASWGKLYLRVEKRKPGKAELKLQSVFRF